MFKPAITCLALLTLMVGCHSDPSANDSKRQPNARQHNEVLNHPLHAKLKEGVYLLTSERMLGYDWNLLILHQGRFRHQKSSCCFPFKEWIGHYRLEPHPEKKNEASLMLYVEGEDYGIHIRLIDIGDPHWMLVGGMAPIDPHDEADDQAPTTPQDIPSTSLDFQIQTGTNKLVFVPPPTLKSDTTSMRGHAHEKPRQTQRRKYIEPKPDKSWGGIGLLTDSDQALDGLIDMPIDELGEIVDKLLDKKLSKSKK